MNFYINTNTPQFTISPDPFFLQSYFQYQFVKGILQLGNTGRTINVTFTCTLNGTPLTIGPLSLNIPANAFNTSSEYISTVSNVTANNWTFNFIHKHVGNQVEIYANKQEFLQYGINDPIFYTWTIDAVSPATANLALGSNVRYNLLFCNNYTDTKTVKLEMTSAVADQTTQETSTIYNYSNLSNLVTILAVGEDGTVCFNTPPYQNPAGLANYQFSLVDEENNSIILQEFNGLLQIFR